MVIPVLKMWICWCDGIWVIYNILTVGMVSTNLWQKEDNSAYTGNKVMGVRYVLCGEAINSGIYLSDKAKHNSCCDKKQIKQKKPTL